MMRFNFFAGKAHNANGWKWESTIHVRLLEVPDGFHSNHMYCFFGLALFGDLHDVTSDVRRKCIVIIHRRNQI
jgi:hypothetical protein